MMQYFCDRCGGLFNLPPKSRGRKYCDECGIAAKREYSTAYQHGLAKKRGVVSRINASIQKHREAIERLEARLKRIMDQ